MEVFRLKDTPIVMRLVRLAVRTAPQVAGYIGLGEWGNPSLTQQHRPSFQTLQKMTLPLYCSDTLTSLVVAQL